MACIHWFLVVVNPRRMEIQILDSLVIKKDRRQVQDMVSYFNSISVKHRIFNMLGTNLCVCSFMGWKHISVQRAKSMEKMLVHGLTLTWRSSLKGLLRCQRKRTGQTTVLANCFFIAMSWQSANKTEQCSSSCGLYMLKNIQLWTGEELSTNYDQVYTLSPMQLSIFKKILTYTWYAGPYQQVQKTAPCCPFHFST